MRLAKPGDLVEHQTCPWPTPWFATVVEVLPPWDGVTRYLLDDGRVGPFHWAVEDWGDPAQPSLLGVGDLDG